MDERFNRWLLPPLLALLFLLIVYQYVSPACPGAACPRRPPANAARRGGGPQEREEEEEAAAGPRLAAKFPFARGELCRRVRFDMRGRDVIVFLHIQKTGGTTFGRHLVRNIHLEQPCYCRAGQKKCVCHRPGGDKDTWLFSRFSTGWSCGLHADWTELTSCVPAAMERRGCAGNRTLRLFDVKSKALPYGKATCIWEDSSQDNLNLLWMVVDLDCTCRMLLRTNSYGFGSKVFDLLCQIFDVIVFQALSENVGIGGIATDGVYLRSSSEEEEKPFEIRPEGKKLPKKQYCMFQYFEISVSVYTSSALPVEVASVSVEKHKNFEFSFVHISFLDNLRFSVDFIHASRVLKIGDASQLYYTNVAVTNVYILYIS
ncbi:hypothetical protein HGM15179_007248 [Zosterops borbonicus]|uniref:Heparan-sulfate 6-O-sulfotransferase n=1 Tax=Zosterops borbonicus TaxID=364589 RepID=A0A8K1GJW3_9PASS|nr:hypothetical protein HGM15179_007248 [Zosterops borbonicus]